MRHGAVACRIGGRRLALLVEQLDVPGAHALADELATALRPLAEARVGCATWVPGLTGDDVVQQARAALVSA